MSKSAHVVDGEASESESEIEVEIGRTPDSHLSPSMDNFVISGEAPESDDESKLSPADPIDIDLPLNTALSQPTNPSKLVYTSLLHQKLWECNVSLRATIEGLIRHTTDISVEKLTSADKTLLNVQESMRATNANLTLAKARLQQLCAALDKANCATALPTVKVKH
ncbi:uncharacterized protein LOC113517145 [Galleria mellonella]|uniref:Biogenesis of lysosome-related organelles complex 1 subunit 3 n=1 Tax=Galleria mellonella TaxID=7137 RepID=A0A6J1WXM3_GALME|nr:uncharacterized protein LOC113517145 [Galleria mellonella]